MSWQELEYASPADEKSGGHAVYTPNPMLWGQKTKRFMYSPLRCATCGKLLADKLALLKHSLEGGSEHPAFECHSRDCRRRFVDHTTVFVVHAKTCKPPHHVAKENPIFACRRVDLDCEFVGVDGKGLDEHAAKHAPFVCHETGCTLAADEKLFTTGAAYEEHLEEHMKSY